MSNWTHNLRPGILKRSPEMDEFVKKEWKRKQNEIRRHNWKIDQIEKLKKQRETGSRSLTSEDNAK